MPEPLLEVRALDAFYGDFQALFGGLVAAATKQWRTEGCGTVAEMLAAFDAYLAQTGPALAGHWTAR